MAEYDYKPIVLDTGSGMMKAGFADYDAPRAIFPSIVGKARYTNGGDQEDYVVGYEALSGGGHMELSHPMQHGIVENWELMEKIWRHTFYAELHIEPEEHPVLFTEAVQTSRRDREQSIQTIFETFDIPATYLAMQPLLSMYSTGCTTGIVLDLGDGVSQAVPVFEAVVVKRAIQRVNFAGADITSYLADILKERGYRFTGASQLDIVRAMKEKFAYVARDCELEFFKTANREEKNYQLPDGQVIAIGQERFRCTEILFDPSMIGVDGDGIHDAVYNSIMMIKDENMKREMFNNIVLSGGTTMLPGISHRFYAEISEKVGPVGSTRKITVNEHPYRKYSAWSGGSILASLSTFQQSWISKAEYYDYGASIVHKKCT